ncbi:sulfatase [Halalkalibaculum sp. DA384]|uniref:sulfatase family protein n=1 Tax=Halalkalibaculum sp. DA384 TaxID=3373606 RepID=UPI003755106F
MKKLLSCILLLTFALSLQAQQRPNIIWLIAEDISTDLETYGMAGVETPNLNKLAEQGIKYTNAFSTNPICSPNRSAMMVGAHQNMIGAQHHRSNRNRVLPDPYKPITYWLRKAGYTNIVGHHGVMGNGRKIDVNFKHERLGPYNGEDAFGIFDKLDTLGVEEQPFFAQVQLNVTHRGDWWNRIRRESPDPVDPESIELPPYMADHPVIRMDWARYLDQIEYMDREVGMIMEELEEKGIAENTVVIFVGDNGRANIRGKGYLYDPGLRVPLLVRWPEKLEGGQVSDQVISTTDITASTLQLAGAELPDYLTGIPFINTESSRKAVFSARDLWDEVMERSRSVSTERFKYIRHDMPWVPFDAAQAYLEFYRPAVHVMRSLYHQGKLDSLQASFFTGAKPTEELYDLQEDPHETNNLINDPDYRDQLRRLRDMLEEWEATLPASSPNDHDLVVPIAPELLEWVQYERTPRYLDMLEGEEIGFGRMLRQYRNRN